LSRVDLGHLAEFRGKVPFSLAWPFTLIEKAGLELRRQPARDTPMGAGVDAVDQAWMAVLENLQRLGPAAGEPLLLPDLVEPARIAAITCNQVLASDAQPPGDPDLDGVGFRERPRRPRWFPGCCGESFADANLTVEQHALLIAAEKSKSMASPDHLATAPLKVSV
jgi:hypothetical protein